MMSVIIMGCGSPELPVNPSTAILPDNTVKSANVGANNRLLWGLWHVSLNARSMEASIVPIRGAMFTCNVTQFMQPPISPVNMVSIAVVPGSDPVNGYFIVDVSLKHPFPGMNQYNGFDVRGIFMSDGSLASEHDPTAIRAGEGESVLLNPDGFTRFWNPTEFTSYNKIFGFTHGKLAPPNLPTSTINPYKYFCDGLGVTDPVENLDATKRGFFTSGSTNKRRYEIKFKMDGPKVIFDFNYAVDASWSPPDPSYAPSYPQDAFEISANVAEPYHMTFKDAGSTAWYVNSGNWGGEFKFALEIFDRQAPFNPDGVFGEIAAIWLESSALIHPVDVLASAVVLPGNTTVSSIFEVSLGSLDLNSSGPVEFLATIESRKPSTYEPQVAGGNLFAYPNAPLAAYFTFKANVLNSPPATIKILKPNGGETLIAGGKYTITWDPGTVTGTIFLEYSKDNFVSDVHLIASGEPNDGSYEWANIPDDPSTTVRARVSSTSNPAINDKSDGDFSIIKAQWPTEPVLVDPDHPVYATRFAVDSNGRVHALYTDNQKIWWSYSDDYGNSWTNIDPAIYTVPANHILYSWEIAMDAAGNYVYALFNETDHHPSNIYDPSKCYAAVKAGRLDITNLSAGWEIVTMWELTTGYDGRQNFSGAQISVTNEGKIMTTGILYAGTGDFRQYFSYIQSWSGVAGAQMLDMFNYCENGSQTYTYPRYTIHLVHDSQGLFYFTTGGNFNDYNSSNGYGTDYGNTILRYDPAVGRWRFIQTSHHDASVQYWLTEARGLAIDPNDNLHWVFLYGYDWYSNVSGCYATAGKWKLCYATGKASGDHDMNYQDPIGPSYFVDIPSPGYNCAYYGDVWFHTSIGADSSNGVVIIYQKAWNVCEIYAIRNDNGSGWTSPVNIDGPGLYGSTPWGRMHPDGWFLLTFTDRDNKNPTAGSNLPYFVAWK